METPQPPQIDLTPVVSSQLAAVGYDPATQTLAIQFKSGGIYHYANVPANVYQGLMDGQKKDRPTTGALSTGSYFYRNIKPYPNQYPYTRINPPQKGGK